MARMRLISPVLFSIWPVYDTGMRLWVLSLVLATGFAQESHPTNPLQPLADAARAAPPEFCFLGSFDFYANFLA